MVTSLSPISGERSQVAGTAAFSKFVHLLQLVADSTEPLSIAELSKASGYPRPTVHRTVTALIAEGFLEESPRTGRLALGSRLIQLASQSWGRSELRLASVGDLERLRDLTGETVHLAVLNGQRMVYVEKLDSASAVQMSSRVGTTVALHSSSVGKAFLAALPEPDCERLIRGLPTPFPAYTPNTLTSIGELRNALASTRARGWSSDDEEQEPGVYCFGSAILGPKGLPVAAVSISTLRFRQKPDPLQSYVKPLLETCKLIAQRLAQTPTASEAHTF